MYVLPNNYISFVSKTYLRNFLSRLKASEIYTGNVTVGITITETKTEQGEIRFMQFSENNCDIPEIHTDIFIMK